MMKRIAIAASAALMLAAAIPNALAASVDDTKPAATAFVVVMAPSPPPFGDILADIAQSSKYFTAEVTDDRGVTWSAYVNPNNGVSVWLRQGTGFGPSAIVQWGPDAQIEACGSSSYNEGGARFVVAGRCGPYDDAEPATAATLIALGLM